MKITGRYILRLIILLFVGMLITHCDNQNEVQMKNEMDWKNKLTKEQYRVTREGGTEAPYTGIYDDFFEKGHYNCVCCNKTLFDSDSKFASGCGWPSFSNVFYNERIKLLEDTSHNMVRTEVRCANCDAHLGHLFNDGPPPTGLRYCINSVSLVFVSDSVSESFKEDISEKDDR